MAREDRIARREQRQRERELRRMQRDKDRADKAAALGDDAKEGGFLSGKGGAIASASITGATTLANSIMQDTDPDSYMSAKKEDIDPMAAISKIGSLTATGASVGGPAGAAVGAAVGIASVGIDYAKGKKFNRNLQQKQDQQKIKVGEESALSFEQLQNSDKEKSLKYLSNMNSPKYNRFKRSSYS